MYNMHFNKQMEEKKKKNDVDTFGNEKTKAVMSWLFEHQHHFPWQPFCILSH